ncbi:MAG: hypothetical protein DMG10_12030 [Acidobacteria bacterium]|nr:MAG: hypothetical protein DMG10_12030 [Acidobacteriota bacterium]
MTLPSLTSPASPLTQKGHVLGTFQYVSPEQLQGREADVWSDIFAFGAVLYEMATGRRAFEGKSQLSVAAAILEKEPEPVSSLQKASPPALDHVIATCLAKNPDERWQCAADVARELVWIAQAPTRAPAAKNRHQIHKGALFAAAVALAVALGLCRPWQPSVPPAKIGCRDASRLDRAGHLATGFCPQVCPSADQFGAVLHHARSSHPRRPRRFPRSAGSSAQSDIPDCPRSGRSGIWSLCLLSRSRRA